MFTLSLQEKNSFLIRRTILRKKECEKKYDLILEPILKAGISETKIKKTGQS
jgi:hypothetical protein